MRLSTPFKSQKGFKIRFRLSLSYDGTEFSGWGVQPEARTVQGALTEACQNLFGSVNEITAAGRTDAGVHAKCQTVHLDIDKEAKASDVQYRLNALLPKDVVVDKVQKVPDDFHARYHCLAKQYVYTVSNGSVPPLFDRPYVLWEKRPLDLHALRAAAKYLVGEQDFASFMNVGRDVESTVREIRRFSVKRRHGQMIFSVLGTGFLYNQVRIMVGTLLEIGLKKRPPEDMLQIIEAKDRKEAGPTAPAPGLCLQKTIYKGDESEKMLF